MIVVPVSDTWQFPDPAVIARTGNLAAPAGDTLEGRTRSAYDFDEAFLEAVSTGLADRFTFPDLEEATRFAERKLAAMCTEAVAYEVLINRAEARSTSEP